MLTTCLYVLTIIGLYCYNAPPPPEADCWSLPEYTICTIEAEELPIRAGWYYPPLGGTNCVEPCDLTGDGTPVESGYGWIAGCPIEWWNNWLDLEYAGRWQCRDTGGIVWVQYGEVYSQYGWTTEWFIYIDFLLREPEPWTYFLLEWEVVDD